jgi:uncharacterized protein
MYIHASKMWGSAHPVEESFPRPAMAGIGGRHEPIRVTATLQREDEYYRFAGRLATRVELACARCNNVLEQAVELEFSLRYMMAGSTLSQAATLDEDHELSHDECNIEELDDEGRINLISFSRDQIYLALPLQLLCREGCLGLCSQCGIDLNNKACACAMSEPDPRLAALAELRNRL